MQCAQHLAVVEVDIVEDDRAEQLLVQRLVETFDGPNLPSNWAVRSGVWSIANGRISVSSTAHNYMTIPGTKLLNCVLDVDVYWAGLGVQAGGVCARHGGTSTEDCVMAKVQANSATVNGLDRIYNYERPGGAVSTVLNPLATKTRIRMLCVGSQAFLQLDTNQDGIFDTTQAPLTTRSRQSSAISFTVSADARSSVSSPAKVPAAASGARCRR